MLQSLSIKVFLLSLLSVVAVLYICMSIKYFNDRSYAPLQTNIIPSISEHQIPVHQRNTSGSYGIGIYGDWTVDKVGSFGIVHETEKNGFIGRSKTEMCNLNLSKSHHNLFRDTVNKENIIFHNAAILIDKPLKSRRSKIDVFWHMGAVKDYTDFFQKIVSRQHALLRSSGLWEAAYGIHIGIVGYAELPPELILDIAISSHVEIFARVPSGDESVTTTYMRELCRLRHWSSNNQQNIKHGTNVNPHNGMVMYFHTRGISHELDNPTQFWTYAMEYFIITKWQYASAIILSGADTAGISKYIDQCRPHYSGNFFWASVDYIASLPDPNKDVEGMPFPTGQSAHKYSSGEMWLLAQDPYPGKHVHFKLHSPIVGLQSYFNHYVIPYYFKYYSCSDTHEVNMPSRIPCGGVEFKPWVFPKRKPRIPRHPKTS